MYAISQALEKQQLSLIQCKPFWGSKFRTRPSFPENMFYPYKRKLAKSPVLWNCLKCSTYLSTNIPEWQLSRSLLCTNLNTWYYFGGLIVWGFVGFNWLGIRCTGDKLTGVICRRIKRECTELCNGPLLIHSSPIILAAPYILCIPKIENNLL